MLKRVPVWLRLIALAEVANVFTQLVRALRDPLDTDFVGAFLTAAKVLQSGNRDVYCISCQNAILANQFHVVPKYAAINFANPPLAAWLLQPLTGLSPATALAIFIAFSIAASAGAVLILRNTRLGREPGLLIAVVCIANLPGAQTFALGQWNALLLLPLAAAFWALEKNRYFLAGILLSMLLVKPQLIWLSPFVFLAQRNWRLPAGVLAGALIWIAGSIAAVGWENLLHWFTDVLPVEAGIANTTVGVPGFFATAHGSNFIAGAVGVLLAACLLIFLAVKGRSSNGDDAILALALTSSLLFTLHALPHDLLIVGIPLLVVARRMRVAGLGFTVALGAAYILDLLLPVGFAHAEALVMSALLVTLLKLLTAQGVVAEYA